MKKTDYNLAVYCGARSGNDPLFTTRAQELGTLCAQNNIGVVYGGGRTGLMGTIAGATLDAGGVGLRRGHPQTGRIGGRVPRPDHPRNCGHHAPAQNRHD